MTTAGECRLDSAGAGRNGAFFSRVLDGGSFPANNRADKNEIGGNGPCAFKERSH